MMVCCFLGDKGTSFDDTVEAGYRNTDSTRNVVESWEIIEREDAPTPFNEAKISQH